MNFNNLKTSLTFWILASLVMGAVVGYLAPDFAKELDILGKVFLKLIKTIVAPLLFATLIVGIAGHGDSKTVGRMGVKAFSYFIAVTSLALVFGLLAINISKAGDDPRINKEKAEKFQSKSSSVKKDWKDVAAPMVMQRTETILKDYEAAPDSLKAGVVAKGIDSLQATFAVARAKADVPPKQDWKDIISHIFPENIAKSIAENQVLQIVVFSILFGLGINAAGGEHRDRMVRFCESLTAVMFKFTKIVMYFAPFGVFGAMASAVAVLGPEVFYPMLKLILTLYGALIAFVVVVFGSIVWFMKINVRKFWASTRFGGFFDGIKRGGIGFGDGIFGKIRRTETHSSLRFANGHEL
jgi:proton glutamate symport protein